MVLAMIMGNHRVVHDIMTTLMNLLVAISTIIYQAVHDVDRIRDLPAVRC